MTDRLSLSLSSEAARQERRQGRRQWLGMLALVGLAVLVTLALPTLIIRFAPPSSARLWRLRGGVWQEAGELPGSPVHLRVSAAGAVWVSTESRAGLSRWDGAAWQSYGATDFGTSSGYLRGGFALDGEEVWAAHEQAVLRYDGRGWACYPEALVTNEPAAIAAGGGEAWVIDRKGNLSHFDGRGWTVSSLRDALPGVRWGGLGEREPTLARAPDGSLWLAKGGLWRLDAQGWQEVRPGGLHLGEVRLLGAAAGKLWLADGPDLASMAPDGALSRYTPAEMGLPDSAWLYDVAAAGERLYVASGEGVAARDGTAWVRLPLPGHGSASTIRRAALAPDGALWAVAARPFTVWGALTLLAPLGLMLLGMLALTFIVFGRSTKSFVQGQARVRQVVESTTTGLPAVGQPSAGQAFSWKAVVLFVLTLVALPFVAMPIYGGARYLLEAVWPGAPDWAPLALIGGAAWLIFPLARRLFARSTEAKPRTPLWRDLVGSLLAEGGLVAMFLAIQGLGNLLSAAGTVQFLGPAVLVLGSLAILVLLPLAGMAPFLWVDRALRRADYDGALRRVAMLRRLSPQNAGYLFLEGTVLLFAGRPAEAERLLRASLAEGQKAAGPNQSVALDNLGDALMEQGRYEEAARAYEGSVEVKPDRGGPYIGLAEVYLRQGRESARALELAERALEHKRSSWLMRRVIDRYVLGQMWADKAWALALLGRHADASQALEMAFKETDLSFKPMLAGLHWRAGQVMRLSGDRTAARERFERARRVDPAGQYAHLAARALEDMDRAEV